MRIGAFRIGLLVLAGIVQQVHASVIGLTDWCANLNGDISTACNGAGNGGNSSGGGSISLAGYDKTLQSSAANNLGTITITLAPGLNQYVNFYADYNVDYTTFLSADDFGSIHGALPVGVTYELDDPNTGNIFTDFQNNALKNTNNVGTPAGPPNNCCDVSFALGLGGLNVGAGGATVTFTVSKTAPAGGFYLTQTNQDVRSDSIYVQGTLSTLGTPEPSTFILVSSLLFAGFLWRRFRAA